MAHNLMSCLADAFAIQHIALEERELLAALSQTLNQRLARFCIQVQDGDRCATSGECAGHFAAKNPGAAGNGHSLPQEVVHLRQFHQIEGDCLCILLLLST